MISDLLGRFASKLSGLTPGRTHLVKDGGFAEVALQTGPADTTAGALMGVGALGWGGASLAPQGITSWNNLPRVNGRWTANNLSDGPKGSLEWLILDQLIHNHLWGMQTALVITGSLQNRLYRRTLTNGTWNPWREFYLESNVVGPITSSVEGAIIERGANGNGEYIRYADGTQHCWHSYVVSASLGPGVLSGALTWTFPAAFATKVSFSVENVSSWGYEYFVVCENVNLTNLAGIYIKNIGSNNRTMNHTLFLMSSGRWF